MIKKSIVLFRQHTVYVAWAVSLTSLVVSLYFSDVLHVPPCTLCWYQRILMYPLALFLPIGIIRKDETHLHWYALPLSILGMGIALYHTLLQAGIISQALAPCTVGVSCISDYRVWLPFLSIPLLSFIAFTIITICMVLYGTKKRVK